MVTEIVFERRGRRFVFEWDNGQNYSLSDLQKFLRATQPKPPRPGAARPAGRRAIGPVKAALIASRLRERSAKRGGQGA